MNRCKENNNASAMNAAAVVDIVIVPSRIGHGSVGHDCLLHMGLARGYLRV